MLRSLLLILILTMAHTPRNIQAPNVAADFWTQWGSINPRMCVCVKITPRVGTAIGLTSNTRDMTLPGHVGITFKATPGITPTVIESSLDEPTILEMTGIYNADSFTDEAVRAGTWNFAEVEVFSVSWQDVDLGEFLHFRGNMGEFKDYQTFFTAEGRGLLSRLSNDVNIVTSRFCRVKDFCDTQCGKAVTDTVLIGGNNYEIQQVNKNATPGIATNSIVFTLADFDGTIPVTLPEQEAYAALWANGKITGTSGANNGVSRELSVGTDFGANLILYVKRPFPNTVSSGDDFTITMGCNRTIEDCMKFGNIVNRRAEDWIPGLETANRVRDAN